MTGDNDRGRINWSHVKDVERRGSDILVDFSHDGIYAQLVSDQKIVQILKEVAAGGLMAQSQQGAMIDRLEVAPQKRSLRLRKMCILFEPLLADLDVETVNVKE
ncbi:unnamed protein product [Clonostachys rosea]|uniref:Uncharacterized protein n=1 Tax=Bionectria ochroleuca TaxID=29856 RepID=A0ABY6U0F7_BIOOC|nr:unnamed protein product [Clonostachys rosea]